ncbi:MAG: TlpA family protein disulfide reductase [Chloroflexi bacterium]|nr:TlpA family protein disulfide reductase [Chloroflexota bacterium]
MATLSVGQVAPAFSLRGADGTDFELNQHGARLTLAVFFKTTCPTCVLAFPYFEKMHQTLYDAGLVVWGISQNDRARSVEFARRYGSTFPILIDDAWRVSNEFDPEFVPTAFLIDRAGKIVERVVAFDKAGLNRVAHSVATTLSVAVPVIAPDKDGNPPFRPG